MPPANTGSKGALITWTVVSTVFGITFIVLAGIAFAAKSDAEKRVESLEARLNEVASEGDIASEPVSTLKAQKAAANSSQTHLRFAISQGQELAQLATGADAVPVVREQISGLIAETSDVVAGSGEDAQPVPLSTLSEATTAAIAEVRNLRVKLDTAEASLSRQEGTTTSQRDTYESQLAQLRQEVRTSQEQLNETIARTQAAQQGYEELTATLAETVQELTEELGTENLELAGILDTLAANVSNLERDVSIAAAVLSDRVGGTTLVTKADGRVIRSPSENRLTIDLGRRDGVTRGMTFAVYDETTGIPQLSGDLEDPETIELPRGKASILLVNVGDNSSEARIIRQQPGTAIQEQDIIANLAYDRDSPRRFYVYGEFDFNADGIFASREGAEISSLISEFGGQIVRDVTVDTDIVVLGREPVIPQFNDEELLNPVNRNLRLDAQNALRDYNRVQREAEKFNKSILNQNQLLALIGYYETARR